MAKTCLLLGCGLVAPPLIHYLSENGVHVIVASRTKAKTDEIVKGLKNVTSVAFDIESKTALEELDKLTQQCDIVCSLLPYIHHVAAAKIAIKHKKHFTTTSYVSDEMKALAPAAEAAGVLVLNEMGVDPGLDFMSAQKIIDEVHQKGGKVVGFYSICGGLPAPQDNNNPFGYKLSWSPRGVLLASRNNASYLEKGKKVDVPGVDLYTPQIYRTEHIGGKLNSKFEWYPNRDSLKYIELFGIPEVQTIIRGTYRNVSWCDTMRIISLSGLTSLDPLPDFQLGGATYSEFARRVLGVQDVKANLSQAAAQKWNIPADSATIKKLEWLGLFSEQKVPANIKLPIDALCHLFESKMQYGAGEKDMILMKHTFEVRYSDAVRETITSTLVDFGLQPNGFSSMARTVSLPVAIAIRAVCEGRFNQRGLVRPFSAEIYNLVLPEMARLGVVFHEERLGPLLHVRHEVKPNEERVPIVPAAAQQLIKAGYRIHVERSPTRCIPDDAYAKAGCELVPTGSWAAPATEDAAIVLGVKELPESKEALVHRHIYFAHCFKDQAGWKDILGRFAKGQGLLWDLEFLVDDQGRRVAAFGRPAGIAGMAVAFLAWAKQQIGKDLGALSSWKSTEAMLSDVKAQLAATGKPLPSVLVLGALGRCGNGACWVAEQVGIQPTKWDIAETKKGGPFPELLQHDIVVNAIYLSEKIPPFIDNSMLDDKKTTRKLSVISDVSCDTTNPNNPLPIYNQNTTMVHPVLRVRKADQGGVLDIIAIDHLPTLVPTFSSEAFCQDLMPTLLELKNADKNPVWLRAQKLFESKLAAALK